MLVKRFPFPTTAGRTGAGGVMGEGGRGVVVTPVSKFPFPTLAGCGGTAGVDEGG